MKLLIVHKANRLAIRQEVERLKCTAISPHMRFDEADMLEAYELYSPSKHARHALYWRPWPMEPTANPGPPSCLEALKQLWSNELVQRVVMRGGRFALSDNLQ